MSKLDYEITKEEARSSDGSYNGEFWLIKIFNGVGQVVRTITQTSRNKRGDDARYEDAVQTARDYIRRNG